MRTLRRICAIAFLTTALSTFALADGEGWIGTGHKPTQTAHDLFVDGETQELNITETGEESSYFDELYEATLLFLQMNLL
ncbi:MAG TPA: hypothetical protein VEY11_08110 [Pyrinomonadaceae bacterium]|nr:hypothetical protein [Pyrinomonadaceae bacterium]